MARTTAEHEAILDIFDDLLTLGYLYADEMTRGPDLKEVQALAYEVTAEMSQPMRRQLFPDERTIRGAICEVMNRLQRACRLKAPPTKLADDEWVGMPDVLEGRALRQIHAGQETQLADLLTGLIARIGSDFPDEVKPFITPEQVKALLRGQLTSRCQTDFCGPVQVDLLARLAHQIFLASLEPSEASLLTPGRMLDLIRGYVKKAERSFVDMVRESVIVDIVSALYPRAQKLRLTIDKTYPWGALWRHPMSARDCLDVYAQLNRSGVIRDAKCNLDAAPGAGIPAAEFIGWGRAMIPSPREVDQDSVARKYFKSDDADLHINGNRVQKHAVMAVRYDRPLHDVERTLRHFRNYLLHQRKEYCSTSGETLNDEELALTKLVVRDLLNKAKPARAVLHDKSGVLGHLCALMDLEMQRDPEQAAKPKKARMPVIEEVLRDAGFDYSGESVRKSCARAANEISTLRARFVDG